MEANFKQVGIPNDFESRIETAGTIFGASAAVGRVALAKVVADYASIFILAVDDQRVLAARNQLLDAILADTTELLELAKLLEG